jgi:hypothetical protein
LRPSSAPGIKRADFEADSKEKNMHRTKTFRLLCSSRLPALVALAAFAFLFATANAKAGCGVPFKPGTAPPIPFVSPKAARPSNHRDDEDSRELATIVGLWHVVYTATYTTSGPLPVPIVPPAPPFPIVQSFKTWHSDGTEFDNAFLPPSGGNICFGVWKDLGHRTVKLHHVGLMFAPDGSLANIFYQDEIDTVAANGKTYEGTFDQKLYDPTDIFGTGTVVQEIKGTTAGTRITVD